MSRITVGLLLTASAALAASGCILTKASEAPLQLSHAVFAEFGQSNKVMVGGLNRRVFNKVVSIRGDKIVLTEDGCVSVQAGTYRFTGMSLITMQNVLEPIQAQEVYPGYCVLHESRYSGRDAMANAVAIGSLGVALYSSPSHFDTVATFGDPAEICLGHQAGQVIKEDVFLTFVDGDPEGPSAARLYAQLSVFELPD
jgi:hypothetical protein